MKITPHKSLSLEDVERIYESITYWTEWANAEAIRAEKGRATPESATSGYRVVESKYMELRTGVPHCACCLKPRKERNSNEHCQEQ